MLYKKVLAKFWQDGAANNLGEVSPRDLLYTVIHLDREGIVNTAASLPADCKIGTYTLCSPPRKRQW